MTVHVVLLRGINVGTSNRIAMGDLRGVLDGLGHTEVRTLAASGNVVLAASTDDPVEVARSVRRGILDAFGLSIPCMVRSRAQIERVVDGNPMPDEAESAPTYFHVGFCDPLLAEGADDAIDETAIAPERLVVHEGTLYLWFAGGLRNSALARALSRHGLDAHVTMRNWNTVRRLRDLARDQEGAGNCSNETS